MVSYMEDLRIGIIHNCQHQSYTVTNERGALHDEHIHNILLDENNDECAQI